MKYHLGCGTNYLDGYINVDFPQEKHTIVQIKADIYESLLTLKYESCGEIRSHHVFEHFNYIESIALLIKWTRALQSGGTLRIDLPDVETLCEELNKSYRAQNTRRCFKLIRLIFGSHESDWAYHINGWNSITLSYVLEKFGYDSIQTQVYGNQNAEFPNCGLDMTFMKSREVPDLIPAAREILGLYTELPVEKPLHDYFCRTLDSLL
jgi:predicted SAM-dependent methyltransferase